MANNTAQGKTLEKKGFKLPISGNALVLLIALVLVTAIFSALNPNYFTYGNFINIMVSSTLIGLTSIGMTFLIMTGGSDLSAGSVAAFGGVFIAWGLKNTSLNIQEIAIKTNFANQSSLGRFFRKHTGMSLSQYRMSNLEQ